jgi:putative peptidoglycan lipid II flippase
MLLLLLSLTYLGQVCERAFQSYLPSGAVGALTYAWVLVSMTPGLLYLGNPFMAAFAERRHAGSSGADMLDPLLTFALLVCLPATGFLTVFGADVIRLLLERGVFNPQDTALTARAIAGYAPALLAVMLMPPLRQAFQVLERNGVLVVRALVSLAATAGLNALFVFHFGWGSQGIALAFAIGQLLMLALSFRFLHAEGVYLAWGRHVRFALYVGLGTVVALGAARGLGALSHAAWLVMGQALLFALIGLGWASMAPGPEGALIRGTLARLARGRRAALSPAEGSAA